MKFSEKYPNTKPGDVIDKDTLLVGKEEKPCQECGSPTRFIDYCSEGHFCSDECMHNFYDWLNEAQKKHIITEPDNIPPYELPMSAKPHEKAKIVLVEPSKAARITEMERRPSAG